MKDSFDNFLVQYQRKTYDEILESTWEIKSSSISKYEYLLNAALRNGDKRNCPPGELVDQKYVLENLINAKSPASSKLREHLDKIEEILNKGKY